MSQQFSWCRKCGRVHPDKLLKDESGQLTAQCLDLVCGGMLERFKGLDLTSVCMILAEEVATVLIPEDFCWGEGSRIAAEEDKNFLTTYATAAPITTDMGTLFTEGERVFCPSIQPKDLSGLIDNYNTTAHTAGMLQYCKELSERRFAHRQDFIDEARLLSEKYIVGFFIALMDDDCLAEYGAGVAEHQKQCQRDECPYRGAQNFVAA